MNTQPLFLGRPQGRVADPVTSIDANPFELLDGDGELAPKVATAITAAFCATGLFTLLYLCLPIFSLQIFSRLIPAANIVALLSLSVVVAILIVCQCALDWIRATILSRLGSRLMLRAFSLALQSADLDERLRVIRDGERICEFLSGRLCRAIVDVPWSCTFVIGMFVLHEVLGWVTLAAIASIYASWLLSEFGARRISREAVALAGSSAKLLGSWELTSDYAAVAGMWHQTWDRFGRQRVQSQSLAGRAVTLISAFSCGREGLRQLLQILLMSFTAVLVIRGTLDIGVVVACNILFARALTPHEQVVTQLPSIRTVLQAYRRLQAWSPQHVAAGSGTRVRLANVPCTIRASTLSAVGRHGNLILNEVDLVVAGGEIVVVTGTEGCGKTALLNALTGQVLPTSGMVTWNDFPLRQIDLAERSERLGLLQENPCLGEGDISQIVSSHRVGDFSHVEDATVLAGCHDDIQLLSSGYRTEVSSYPLSAGLKTKLALARAFYNTPRFLCLDSPTQGMSPASEQAVATSLVDLRNRGCAIIVATHSVAIMRCADRVLELDGGVVRKCYSPHDFARALSNRATSSAKLGVS